MRRCATLPFIIPLFRLACVFAVVYTLMVLHMLVTEEDWNYKAYKVRNREDIRKAESLSSIARWDREKLLPFNYSEGVKGKNILGITFTFLAPDRDKRRIDDYSPDYITQSLAKLLTAIFNDKEKHGIRFAYVNISVCPLTDTPGDSDNQTFQEISMLKQVLSETMIKYRPHKLDRYPILCQSVYDFANCVLSSSSSLDKSAENYIVILEDDFLISSTTLQQLWNTIHAARQQKIMDKRHVVIQLHSHKQDIRYDLSSVFEICCISAILTLFLFTVWLRLWLKPLMFAYNALFCITTFILCLLFVLTISRAFWLTTTYRLTHIPSLLHSTGSMNDAIGSAMLFPTNLAQTLAIHMNELDCTSLEKSSETEITKGKIIKDFLTLSNASWYFAFPSVFKHVGLYSSYHNTMLNPHGVEE